MGALKIEAKLADITGKYWMYKTKTYKINDVMLIGQDHIISTDSKTLRIPTNQVEQFLQDLLPAEAPEQTQRGLSIPGLDDGMFGELARGLMTSFREVQGSREGNFLKEATTRANAKIAISKAVTDIAKTTIQAKKHLGKGRED